MFTSTGNNFGGGPVVFKDVQESNYLVLNAVVKADSDGTAYLAAEQLEIYVPDLAIDRQIWHIDLQLLRSQIRRAVRIRLHHGVQHEIIALLHILEHHRPAAEIIARRSKHSPSPRRLIVIDQHPRAEHL